MRYAALLVLFLLVVGCGGSRPAPAPTAEASFARDVLPVLATACVPCHAGGADARSAYNVTSYEGVMGTGKDSIPNVVPGVPDSSLLCQMLTQGKMPPAAPLDAAKVAAVTRWVARGAKND